MMDMVITSQDKIVSFSWFHFFWLSIYWNTVCPQQKGRFLFFFPLKIYISPAIFLFLVLHFGRHVLLSQIKSFRNLILFDKKIYLLNPEGSNYFIKIPASFFLPGICLLAVNHAHIMFFPVDGHSVSPCFLCPCCSYNFCTSSCNSPNLIAPQS